MLNRCLLLVITIFLFSAGQLPAAPYQPWSENVFAHIKKEYGPQAESSCPGSPKGIRP